MHYILPEDGPLWTETCCKQISHIHNVQPFLVIDGICLSVYFIFINPLQTKHTILYKDSGRTAQ
jgi:hypothetical protein